MGYALERLGYDDPDTVELRRMEAGHQVRGNSVDMFLITYHSMNVTRHPSLRCS